MVEQVSSHEVPQVVQASYSPPKSNIETQCLTKSLSKIHNTLVGLEVSFQKDVLVLEHIYQNKFKKPLYELRAMLLNTLSQTQQSASWNQFEEQIEKTLLYSAESADYSDLLQNCQLLASVSSQSKSENLSNKFWTNVMMHSDECVRQLLHYSHDDVMKHLIDVTCTAKTHESTLASPNVSLTNVNDQVLGFTLCFTFSENPYFYNTSLVKSYEIKVYGEEGTNIDGIIDYNGPRIVDIKGTKIQWKCKKIEDPIVNHGTVQHFTSLLQYLEHSWSWAASTDDCLSKVLTDYHIGTYMKNVMIPKAYTIHNGNLSIAPSDSNERRDIEHAEMIYAQMTSPSSEETDDVATITYGLADVTPYLDTIKSSPSNERILGGRGEEEGEDGEEGESPYPHPYEERSAYDGGKPPRVLLSLRKIPRDNVGISRQWEGSDDADEMYEILPARAKESSSVFKPPREVKTIVCDEHGDSNSFLPILTHFVAHSRPETPPVIVETYQDSAPDDQLLQESLSEMKMIYGESSKGLEDPRPNGTTGEVLGYRSRLQELHRCCTYESSRSQLDPSPTTDEFFDGKTNLFEQTDAAKTVVTADQQSTLLDLFDEYNNSAKLGQKNSKKRRRDEDEDIDSHKRKRFY